MRECGESTQMQDMNAGLRKQIMSLYLRKAERKTKQMKHRIQAGRASVNWQKGNEVLAS